MADKSLPEQDLQSQVAPGAEERHREERRKLLRRAAIGLPVVLGSVYSRTVWAQSSTGSATGSNGNLIQPAQPRTNRRFT
jgi:hypothetical protein